MKDLGDYSRLTFEYEVAEYIICFQDIKDEHGKHMVVRNESLPERSILTGIGPLPVKQPRVRDKREGETFTGTILPRYLRRVPALDNLIPTLYLKGIFMEALTAILGENAEGLSANTIVHLKRQWETEYKDWAHPDLTDKRYVYFLSRWHLLQCPA